MLPVELERIGTLKMDAGKLEHELRKLNYYYMKRSYAAMLYL